MLRDFLSDEMGSPAIAKPEPRDFLSEPIIPKESLSQSSMYALPRIAEDILRGGYNAFQSIPHYINAAQTEIPGAINAFRNDPRHAASQGLAGIAEMGQNVFNLPHDLVNYLTNRLNLFPEDINQKIQMGRMPLDTQGMINQQFGMPTQAGENLIRGLGRNIDIAIPATRALTGTAALVRNATRRIDTQKVIKSIQSSHDKLLNSAISGFDKVGQEAKRRGINQIPIRQNLISDIADHSLIPDTQKMKDLLLKAYSGDYEGLRDLQSELFHRGNRAKESILESEKNAGEKLLDLRNEINDSISSHFKNTGHFDLANKLNNARGKYRLLQETYFDKKTPLAIKNLVGKDRKIPKNIMNTLSIKSESMKRFNKQNSFAAKKAIQFYKKQNAINTLKRLGYAGGGGILGLSSLAGAPLIYNKLTANE